MEQELGLDLPKKLMECKENLDAYVKEVKECIEIISEEMKLSGSQKLINGGQAVYDNAVESLIPSNEETAKNYEDAAAEVNRIFAALN